eukprot:Gb_27047 [translate_table: standard]
MATNRVFKSLGGCIMMSTGKSKNYAKMVLWATKLMKIAREKGLNLTETSQYHDICLSGVMGAICIEECCTASEENIPIDWEVTMSLDTSKLQQEPMEDAFSRMEIFQG